MKHIVTAILTLALAGFVAADNWETFVALEPIGFAQNLNFLLCLFLMLLALFLLLGGADRAGAASSVEGAKSDSAGEVTRPLPHDTKTTSPSEAATERASLSDKSSAPVLYFLSLLQGKGRLLDFVMEDIAPYSDEQVGQVARVVHQGVREVLDQTMKIEPLHQGSEGDMVAVAANFSTLRYRFVGNLNHQPPFSGKVLHCGWKAKSISLPYAVGTAMESQDPESKEIVQPMEVEVA